MRVCNESLIVTGVIEAKCWLRAGHKGQHEKPLEDGSILKWGSVIK